MELPRYVTGPRVAAENRDMISHYRSNPGRFHIVAILPVDFWVGLGFEVTAARQLGRYLWILTRRSALCGAVTDSDGQVGDQQHRFRFADHVALPRMPSLITAHQSITSRVTGQVKMKSRKPLWGFAQHRECLRPTWRGWLLLTFLGIALLVSGMLTIHPFLAVNERIPAVVLVVEGWVPDYVLEEAKAEFKRHGYRRLYVTGGPLERGGHLSEYKTHADLGAATLVRMGMGKDVVQAVPAPAVRKDRTYTSAVALKNRMHQHASDEASINVVAMGTHARRSRLLFQKAFGEGVRVGIIAVADRDYDPEYWWNSSQGVRVVVDELVAYIYAVFIFPLA